MNLATQTRQWRNGAAGWALVGLVGAAHAGLSTLIAPRLPRAFRFLPLFGIGCAALALLVWAAAPHRWWEALEFRGPSLVVTLTSMGIAALDTLLNRDALSRPDASLATSRLRIAQAASVVFAAVIAVQSLAWRGEIDAMRGAMAASPAPCLPTDALPGWPRTPLNIWATPVLSLLYQDWSPERIILPVGACEQAQDDGELRLTPGSSGLVEGRFDTFPLQWRIAADGACWMRLGSGWHEIEHEGESWQRWSPDRGEVRVLAAEGGRARLSGVVTTLPSPNAVEVHVNGERQLVLGLMRGEWYALDGATLELQPGENRISFVSREPAGKAPPDARDLAFLVRDLEIHLVDPAETCQIR